MVQKEGGGLLIFILVVFAVIYQFILKPIIAWISAHPVLSAYIFGVILAIIITVVLLFINEEYFIPWVWVVYGALVILGLIVKGIILLIPIFQQHGLILIPALLILIVVWLICLYLTRDQRAIRKAQRKKKEEERRKKRAQELEELRRKEEELAKQEEERKMREELQLFTRIVKQIEIFEPAREQLKNEYNYQLNLHGFLKASFPEAVIESQKGSSRPDIVIKDVAIEVKGPTGHAELKTIADKINRYNEHFKGGIICVLFEITCNKRLFDEWSRATANTVEKLGILFKIIKK